MLCNYVFNLCTYKNFIDAKINNGQKEQWKDIKI